MNSKKLSTSCKPICSVTDLVKSLGMSRARFYQLQKEGIFPHPIYDTRTRRQFFDVRLQEICHEVRQTGIGFNGHYILFYSPRKNNGDKPARRKSRSNSQYRELVMTLNNMGLAVNHDEVAEAVKELYPEDYDKQDMGVVIRELYRFLKGRL